MKIRTVVSVALVLAMALTAQPVSAATKARLVKDVNPGRPGALRMRQGINEFTDVRGTLFFAARDGLHGWELWKSDGTREGTVLVKDIDPTGSSRPRYLTDVDGTLFFTARNGNVGPRWGALWKSDGTRAGTALVRDIDANLTSSPSRLTNVRGTLFFVSGYHELWKSDGTRAGTTLVKDFGVENGDFVSQPCWLTPIGQTVFFEVSRGSEGSSLWKSDGTEAGTVLVKEFPVVTGTTHSPCVQLSEFTPIGETLFFYADDGTHGFELWRSDGTEAGTVMVKDINPSPYYPFLSSGPADIAAVGGTLFLSADDGTYGRELWTSDGTATGTELVNDIHPGFDGSFPSGLTSVGGTLFFRASDGEHGVELWKSDGTEAGTALVKDIRPGFDGSGPFGSFPSGLTDFSGTLFFRASDEEHGVELWKSDGTATGTELVNDIHEVGGSGPRGFIASGAVLYFSANDGVHGRELWRLR